MAEFRPATVYDAIEEFSGGVNQTLSPLRLPRNVLSKGINTTVRGDYVTHRPPYQKRALTFESEDTQTKFQTGLFQGRCFYKPDNGPECLMVAISGNLFKLAIVLNVITVSRVNGVTDQSPVAQQHWLWQAEKWVIWNDGINAPVFFDGTTCVRSNFGVTTTFSTTLAAGFVVPSVGASVLAVAFTDVTNLLVGDIVTIPSRGTMQVLNIAGANVDLLNLNALPVGYAVAIGTTVSWSHVGGGGTQLPPGRQGAYGMGRNVMALTDGRTFIISDADGGSSGTPANNFRDAVLNITENNYLAGGGVFPLPSSGGIITAITFTAIQDASLGQGPCQVFTATTVFSVNISTDRTTWQNVTNPILTESLITNGGKGQDSTVNVNGDVIFRSIDGIRSLLLARRDFNVWGTTPISFEVDDILRLDDPGLMRFGSAVVFDNRLLMTTHPITHTQGVYWLGLVALNFDPVSSLRGKAPSVYDAGIWEGMNILSIVLGQFNDVQRAFAIVLNTKAGSTGIELWEVMTDGKYDNDGTSDIRILWNLRSSSLKFGQDDPRSRLRLQLSDGEMHINDLEGQVDFDAGYFPDQYPCRVPWFSWQECQLAQAADASPSFRPRLGLGMPSSKPCDLSNGTPLREFYTFQFDLWIRGHCTIVSARFKATTQPIPEFSKPTCNPICS